MDYLLKIKNNYISTIDDIYGVYLDSTLGFKLLTDKIKKIQEKTIKLFGSDTTIEKLDEAEFMYGIGDPQKNKIVRDPSLLHVTTQGELKERNKVKGINTETIGNLCVVQIYQFWEDKYRKEIAKLLNKEKDDVESDIFEELRHIRRSIIHNGGYAIPEVEKKVKIVTFKEGDKIVLKEDDMRKIITAIKDYLDTI
jgi:hypothetical protein